jgi:hypothetical protein
MTEMTWRECVTMPMQEVQDRLVLVAQAGNIQYLYDPAHAWFHAHSLATGEWWSGVYPVEYETPSI